MTASKVINDRISILNSFIEKVANSSEPSDIHHKNEAIKAKDLFVQLQVALEEHANLKNSGVADPNIMSELNDRIKELASSTMIPLVERNKQNLDNYKKQIEAYSQKKIALEEFINLNSGDGPYPANYENAKSELEIINNSMLEFDKAKKDISDYLFEYEMAFDQIKKMVNGDVIDVIQATINDAQNHLDEN